MLHELWMMEKRSKDQNNAKQLNTFRCDSAQRQNTVSDSTEFYVKISIFKTFYLSHNINSSLNRYAFRLNMYSKIKTGWALGPKLRAPGPKTTNINCHRAISAVTLAFLKVLFRSTSTELGKDWSGYFVQIFFL